MNPVATDIPRLPASLQGAVDQACALIAPTWPLDRFIAVNPWWPMIDQRPEHCHAVLAARGGARAVMPRDYFQRQWRAGRITEHHLRLALAENHLGHLTTGELLAHLDGPAPSERIKTITDLLDAGPGQAHRMQWHDEVEQQISQFCAAEFDQGQAEWHPESGLGLYATWRERTAADKGMTILMGVPTLHRHFQALPADADTLIAAAVDDLGLEGDALRAYFHALLLSLNGWASWCAYRGWQATLSGQTDSTLKELLAIRLAWEWVLFTRVADSATRVRWQKEPEAWPGLHHRHRTHTGWDWVWQRALELAYQLPLIEQLRQPAPAPAGKEDVRAVFCIDVRSEVFRRALEAANPRIQTAGFAGFFGLPIAYRPLGEEEARPQLPGLLAPAMTVTDTATRFAGQPVNTLRAARQRRLAGAELSRRLRWNSASTFSCVEATGLFYAWKLVRDNLLPRLSPAAHRPEPGPLAPSLDTLEAADGGPVPLRERVVLAEGILRNLSLTRDFPPLVLLAGHGSEGINNPHQSGLDCGACCGQTGEVNARLVAALLNDEPVRRGLAERGLAIPAGTHFIAGLHNTTTDELALFDADRVPTALRPLVERLRGDLDTARDTALAERAPSLDLSADRRGGLLQRIKARARDGSQVRPEWGLAGNAAFIAAPRRRTRHLDLAGRAFLHDYEWREDSDSQVLNAIMTAPMIVAHWINMQYYASTVDNPHYGSGNKVLHNVAGGRLGVFEGNGGDLRIGLSLQSLHDGREWVHTPLRLSVFIEAPADTLRDIVNANEPVRQLVDNQWLYLYRIDDDGISRLYQDRWSPAG